MIELAQLDDAFTWIAGEVLKQGVISAVSTNEAEVIHHLERRLTNPGAILVAYNLVPLTGKEHALVHHGVITLERRGNLIYVTDANGARFRASLGPFYAQWEVYLERWKQTHSEAPLP